MWLELKNIDFAEPTPLIAQVDLGCTQSEIVSKESHVKDKIDLFAKITTTDTEAKSTDKTETIQVISWSYDMKGHAGKTVERFLVSWRTHPWNSHQRPQHTVWMVTHLRMRNYG